MELVDYWRLLRRAAVTILVLVFVGLAGGALASAVQAPTYQAVAKGVVGPTSGGDVADLSEGADFAQQVAKTYADVATTPYVLREVVQDLHLQETPAALADQVAASAVTDESVVVITATAATPQGAADIANAVSQRLAGAVEQLTPPKAGSSAAVQMTVVQPATAPSGPVAPVFPVNVALGALVGLAVGLVLAVLRERLNTRIRGLVDVQDVVDAPVLGVVPFDSAAERLPLAIGDAENGTRAEAFRTVRAKLQLHRSADPGPFAAVVTSSTPGEGTSTSAANVAVALARAGRSVVLVDADLRDPSLSGYFGLPESLGLSDVLAGAAVLDDALQPWGEHDLMILPAGDVPSNPSELLQSDAMTALIADLQQRFDVVLFDTPAALPVSDALILAGGTQNTIVVCGAGRVRAPQLQQTVAGLREAGATVLGVVVNRAPVRGPDAGPVAGARSGRTTRTRKAARAPFSALTARRRLLPPRPRDSGGREAPPRSEPKPS